MSAIVTTQSANIASYAALGFSLVFFVATMLG